MVMFRLKASIKTGTSFPPSDFKAGCSSGVEGRSVSVSDGVALDMSGNDLSSRGVSE